LHSAGLHSSCCGNEDERRNKEENFKLEFNTVPIKVSKSTVTTFIPEKKKSIKCLQAISQTSSHLTRSALEKEGKHGEPLLPGAVCQSYWAAHQALPSNTPHLHSSEYLANHI